MMVYMVQTIKLRDETELYVEKIDNESDPDLRVLIEIEHGGGHFLKLQLTANERDRLMQALRRIDSPRQKPRASDSR